MMNAVVNMNGKFQNRYPEPSMKLHRINIHLTNNFCNLYILKMCLLCLIKISKDIVAPLQLNLTTVYLKVHRKFVEKLLHKRGYHVFDAKNMIKQKQHTFIKDLYVQKMRKEHYDRVSDDLLHVIDNLRVCHPLWHPPKNQI